MSIRFLFYPYWTENTAVCVVMVLTLFLAVLATARKFDPWPAKVHATTMSQLNSAYGGRTHQVSAPRHDATTTTTSAGTSGGSDSAAPAARAATAGGACRAASARGLDGCESKGKRGGGRGGQPSAAAKYARAQPDRFPLRDVFHAYTAGEDIVQIRLEIDGAALEPCRWNGSAPTRCSGMRAIPT